MREHFCPYTIQRSTRKSDEIVLYRVSQGWLIRLIGVIGEVEASYKLYGRGGLKCNPETPCILIGFRRQMIFEKKSKGNAKSEFCRHINNFVTNLFKSVQHFRCIRCGKERTILAKYVVYNILHTPPSIKNKKVLHIYYQIKRNLTTILKKILKIR